MFLTRTLFSALTVALSTTGALGHEFWIDPEDFTIAPGEEIVAQIRVGQEFKGSGYSYLPQNFRLFEIAQGDARMPVEGRMGDRPALQQAAEGEGLAIVLHETRDYRLNYKDFADFEAFVRHKDALWTLDTHAERGFPREGFGEAYSRYAKSLVAVGDGAGQDTAYGLETEIVALANPYTDDLSDGMPVRVLYRGAPRADEQVEIFEKAADNSVTVSTVRTDAGGVAVIPVKPGFTYMLDSVVLREPKAALAAELDVVWESLWANLTFAVPAR